MVGFAYERVRNLQLVVGVAKFENLRFIAARQHSGHSEEVDGDVGDRLQHKLFALYALYNKLFAAR